MLFTFTNVLKSIRYRITLNLTIIIAFFIGLYAMFIVITMGDSLLQIYFTMSLKNESDVSVTYISQSNYTNQTEIITLQDIDFLLSEYNFIKDKTIIQGIHIQDVVNNEVTAYYSVLDKNFSNFYNFRLVEGRFFDDDDLNSNDKICIVEENLVDRGKAKIGGYYKIGDESYKIIGVIYTAQFRGEVFLINIREIDKNQSIFYQVALRYENLNDYTRINWDKLNGHISSRTATESFNEGMVYIKSVLVTFSTIGIVLMLYSLINSYNIIVNKVISNSVSYGIYMAVGVSSKKIYWQVFLEIFSLAFIALIFIFAIDPIASLFIKEVMEHYVGLFSIAAMLFITFFTSFIISLLSARRLMKHSVIDMIKRLPR